MTAFRAQIKQPIGRTLEFTLDTANLHTRENYGLTKEDIKAELAIQYGPDATITVKQERSL